jgi:acyl dehydratase
MSHSAVAGAGSPTSAAGGATRGWADLAVGDVLPETVLEVTEQTVILVPVSTWDLFPGHHSPAYARAQGQRDMYLNTIALQGLVDRAITDHLGPDAWVTRRKLAMLGSAYPGDRLSGAAEVVAVRRGTPESVDVEADLTVEFSTADGPALRAEVTVRRYVPRSATTPAAVG